MAEALQPFKAAHFQTFFSRLLSTHSLHPILDLAKKVASIDFVDEIDALSAIGKAIAKEQVDLADFAGFLES